jgi:hypothetical protein
LTFYILCQFKIALVILPVVTLAPALGKVLVILSNNRKLNLDIDLDRVDLHFD